MTTVSSGNESVYLQTLSFPKTHSALAPAAEELSTKHRQDRRSLQTAKDSHCSVCWQGAFGLQILTNFRLSLSAHCPLPRYKFIRSITERLK
jgi:hypothetical protein